MAGLARKGDSMKGQFNSEHGGHYDSEGNPIHSSGVIDGKINGNCSSNVFINGQRAAIVGSIIDETDVCTPGKGVCINGSGNLFINGKPAVRNNDNTTTHVGNTGKITSGSGNVNNGG